MPKTSKETLSAIRMRKACCFCHKPIEPGQVGTEAFTVTLRGTFWDKDMNQIKTSKPLKACRPCMSEHQLWQQWAEA